jgi:vacuolar-type H+-ATPase subunit H
MANLVDLIESRLKQVVQAADGEAERLAADAKDELTAQANQVVTDVKSRIATAKTDLTSLIKANAPTLEADAGKLVDTLLQDVLATLGGTAASA